MIGKEILKSLPLHEFDNTQSEEIPVTAARNYVRANRIEGPAVIRIRRNSHTIDSFYWCKRGMFSAAFVESNYMNFMNLREISRGLVDKGILCDSVQRSLDCEVEEFKCEYIYG
jgi:hypothetical protein